MKKTYHRTLGAVAAAAAAGLGLALPAGGASAATASKPTIYWLAGAGNPYWTAQHLAAATAGQRLGFKSKRSALRMKQPLTKPRC